MSSVLSLAQMLALAMQFGGGADPTIIAGIALHESGFNPAALNCANHNHTCDHGLMQVNDVNLPSTGNNQQTVMVPEKNVAAGAQVWNQALAQELTPAERRALSRYATGNPNDGFTLHAPGDPRPYVPSMEKTILQVREAVRDGKLGPITSVEIPIPPCSDIADIWHKQDCLDQHKGDKHDPP